MEKRMVRSCVIMVYAFILLVSAWRVEKAEKSITKMEQEAFVASILIENTQTGQERILRAGRDEEEIGRCLRMLEKTVPQEQCEDAVYMILVAFDNSKSTYYQIAEEDEEEIGYFDLLFQNMYLPL